MAVFDTVKNLKVSEVETYSAKQIQEILNKMMDKH